MTEAKTIKLPYCVLSPGCEGPSSTEVISRCTEERRSHMGQFKQHRMNEEEPYLALMLQVIASLQKCLVPSEPHLQILMHFCSSLPCEPDCPYVTNETWQKGHSTVSDLRHKKPCSLSGALGELALGEVSDHDRCLNTLDLHAVRGSHGPRGDAAQTERCPGISSHSGHPS